jgi:hypothetical protein
MKKIISIPDTNTYKESRRHSLLSLHFGGHFLQRIEAREEALARSNQIANIGRPSVIFLLQAANELSAALLKNNKPQRRAELLITVPVKLDALVMRVAMLIFHFQRYGHGPDG